MNKVVLITGGTRGIGEAVVRKFYSEGWCVAFCYRREKERAEALAKELQGVFPVCADVSDEAQVNSMVEAVERQFGHIDALVCNAGRAQIKMITDVTADEFDKMFAINVRGTFLTCKAVLPGMIRRQSGSIVNIASIWGEVGASCEVVYSATKGAVIAFTKALAKEVGPSHIRVNCVSPGTVVTDMVASLGEETLEALRLDTPLEILGETRHIADAVYFLSGDSAEFITGQILGVNGGYVI